MAQARDINSGMLETNILQILLNEINVLKNRTDKLEMANDIAITSKRMDEGGDNSSGLFNMAEASLYLRIPKATLYGYTSKSRIAFTKVGRQIFFKREQLDSFLQEHSYRSQKELMIEANTNLAIRRNRKRLD